MCRINVTEPIDKGHEKMLKRDGFPNVLIKKSMKVAEVVEKCFQDANNIIQQIIKKHLKDTSRVFEIYDQFQPIIDLTLIEKIKKFLNDVQEGRIKEVSDNDYKEIIKEIRFYLKLSKQLPTIIFFPMFEVGMR